MLSYSLNLVDFAITLARVFLESGEKINHSASSTSIYLALAMLHLGAKNNSSRQLEKILGADFSSLIDPKSQKSELYVSIKGIYDELCQSGELRNRLFSGIPLKESYTMALSELFQADFEKTSFQNPSLAAEVVNKWVKEQTHGRITNLIDESALSPETVLILANTIYFKGLWKNAFDDKLVQNGLFHLSTFHSMTVPFMAQKDKFNFYDDTDGRFQAVSLEFQQGNALGVFLLPSKRFSLKQFVSSFQAQDLKKILERSYKTELNVRIPKFKLDTNTRVKKILQDLGVTDIFDQNKADLKSMSNLPLWVEDIIHRSTVQIDEKGVVAAAATAIEISHRSLDIEEWFILDRPFIFLIMDQKTRIPLFMNIIHDPSRS